MMNALVVEDDPSYAPALTRYLHRAGWRTFQTDSFHAAKKMLDHNAIDLAFIDLRLPDGNGMALIREGTDLKTQFAIITGHPGLESAIQAIEHRVVGYLPKPLKIAKINSILERVHERRTADRQREAALANEDVDSTADQADAPNPEFDHVSASALLRLNVRVGMTVEQAERELIEATLLDMHGDKPTAAKVLGISLKTLYNKLNSYRRPQSRPRE
ncbi:MAG: response regulator [Gammaproteobacteria bacterium]|nr:response regulator [Gammaproteobacteria bacterium]